MTAHEEVVRKLDDAAVRIRNTMVLYEKLYRSENILTISIKTYMDSLLEGILETLPGNETITVRTEVEDMVMQTGILSNIGIPDDYKNGKTKGFGM